MSQLTRRLEKLETARSGNFNVRDYIIGACSWEEVSPAAKQWFATWLADEQSKEGRPATGA